MTKVCPAPWLFCEVPIGRRLGIHESRRRFQRLADVGVGASIDLRRVGHDHRLQRVVIGPLDARARDDDFHERFARGRAELLVAVTARGCRARAADRDGVLAAGDHLQTGARHQHLRRFDRAVVAADGIGPDAAQIVFGSKHLQPGLLCPALDRSGRCFSGNVEVLLLLRERSAGQHTRQHECEHCTLRSPASAIPHVVSHALFDAGYDVRRNEIL